ncbi:hypothetical protein glysoja_048691 [Glycine soja]|uniref:Uncharacterized protein n=1 Tax=Glycine soja TaxID=3848 RepID=A0A0B2QNB0_GLYSO|nr:hypothetical protein glysoja_048691 [Glycine soja]
MGAPVPGYAAEDVESGGRKALATIQCNLDSSVTIEKFSVRIGWNKFAIYEPEDSNKCALCLLDINGSISDCHIDCEFFE